MSQPLDGLRVLEIADGPAGGFCGRQFAAWGADVVMLEPPGGGPLRQAAPRWSLDGAQGSAAFDVLACGKRSVALAEAPALLAGADVLVCDAPERLGRDLADLRRDHPHLVVVTIGPLGELCIADLEAISGYLSLNGPADGPPLPSPANIMAYAIGAKRFAGALGALCRPRAHRSRRSRAVSGLETIASFVMWLREQNQPAPTAQTAHARGRGSSAAWTAVSVAPAVVPHLPAYREVLGVPDVVDLEGLAEGGRLETTDRVAAALAPLAARLSVEEVFLGPAGPRRRLRQVQSPREVLADRQLEDRAFYQPLRTRGIVAFAGRPALMTDAPALTPSAAGASLHVRIGPRLTPATRPAAPDGLAPGRHARAGPDPGLDRPHGGDRPGRPGRRGGQGGGVTRPDIWRFLGQAEAALGDPTAPENRSFNGANRSKSGLAWTSTTPGAAAFRRLVADADVVLENFTPKVMAPLRPRL